MVSLCFCIEWSDCYTQLLFDWRKT